MKRRVMSAGKGGFAKCQASVKMELGARLGLSVVL